MRQVPLGKNFYTLVGSGRLARHLSFFFKQKNISFNQWSRNNKHNTHLLGDPIKANANKIVPLEKVADQSTHLLLAISDDSLGSFVDKYFLKNTHKLIHFSGSFFSEKAIGMHPLMTFGPKLYPLADYEDIPFIIDHEVSLKQVIPELSNVFYNIKPQQKSLYHSYCVMSGNFTQILWQNLLQKFTTDINLPKQALFPYMNKCIENIKNDSIQALTGPLVREDQKTMNQHIKALAGTPELDLYQAFITYYNSAVKTNTTSPSGSQPIEGKI